MNKTIKSAVKIIKEAEYGVKTLIGSSASTVLGLLFFLFNECIGILHHIAWCIAIGIYYLLLSITRGFVVANSRKRKSNYMSQKRVYILTHILLLIVNLSLIGPIAIMILGEKNYSLGLIPAIAMATYTTYRITMSIIHYKKTRKNHNLLIGEIRLINLVDSLVAILTLQNTMIIATEGDVSYSMKVLSIISSSVIWIAIMILTVFSMTTSSKK